LAHGANNILYSSNRKLIKTETGEPGVRNTALGEVLFVRLAGFNPFGVDNDYRSEVELKASFGVIPADKEVNRAEVDLLRDGVKVESLPVVQAGTEWQTTLQKGRVFNPDSEYHVQFVVNRGDPEEGKSAPKQLRPAWLEFGGTEEVADDSKLDLVKLFNPTPKVSLAAVADPGPGRRVKVRLNGEVRDSLGPISHVAIDGRAVPVTPRSGSEPFVGTFTTEIDVGPQDTLVLVHAMNSLGNLASDQGILTPLRDPNGLITGRSWTPRGDLSPQDEDPDEYAFRIELKDKGQRGESVQVALDTGLETKRVTLRRAGTVFRSDPLYLVPESFQPAATLPQELKDRIVRGPLGLKSKVLYAQNIEEEAASVGALILDANGRAPIDAVQPSDAATVKQALALAVGMSGTAGPELTVDLASLREDLAPASPTSFVPFEQSITLVRQSADPKAGAFNLYLSTEPILPVYPTEAVDRAGFREHGVVASAFLRLRGPAGENVEAVGVPAEKAQWVVEDVRPVFVEGEERPRFFDVVVSARVTGVEGVVPALPLGMAFDLAADVVGETSSVKQVVPVGEVYEDAPFPARTNSDGKTYLRLRLGAAAASSLTPSQQLKGLALRALDVPGGTVLDLLRTLASGAPLPLLVRDALVRSGAAPLTTAFVRGVTEAGVPQGLEVIVGRIVRELYAPIVKAHPAFPAVALAFRNGYQAYGTPLTPEEADELTVALIVGGCLGLPLGFGQAVFDDLNLFAQVRDLVQLLYYAMLASNQLTRVKWLLVAGSIEFVVDEEFRQDVRDRLQRLEPVLVEAAKVATNPEVIKFFGAVVLKAFYDGYDSALGPYTPWLGFSPDSRGEKAFLVGFMMGHVTGYVSEIAVTLFAAGVITAGIGAVVLGATKLSKAGKVARAVSVIRRLSVIPYREASAIEKVAKILLDWFQLVGNVDEAKLAKFLDEAVLLGKEQELLRLVEHYGLDVETIVDGQRLVPRLEALAAALSKTEEPAEVAVRLGQLASKRVLVGGELRPLIFSQEGLERAAKGLDNLILAAKRGQVNPAFVDRVLSALDNPADVSASLGKLQGGDAFLHEGEMLEAFFRAMATQWDGAAFGALERLMNRWATALPYST